jgi:hypothetical protein
MRDKRTILREYADVYDESQRKATYMRWLADEQAATDENLKALETKCDELRAELLAAAGPQVIEEDADGT